LAPSLAPRRRRPRDAWPELLDPGFLGDAYLDARSTADIRRAWLVFVVHPEVRGTSAGTVGLLIAPVDDRWYVWIAH
jgi:hypothetical protein